jgi:hypothetical protein
MAPVRVLRSPPSDVLVLMGILVFVGLFLGTIFVALALPAWRDVHAPPRRVTGTVVALRSVRIDPVGDRLPTGGSKTNYYADVQSPGADALMPVIVGRGLYTRLKQGQAVDFEVLPRSGVALRVRAGPAPNSVLSTDDPLGDVQWWAAAAPWFGAGALAVLVLAAMLIRSAKIFAKV